MTCNHKEGARERKRKGMKRKRSDDESLLLQVAQGLCGLLLFSFLDDKSLFAVAGTNIQLYEETQYVFRARFLRDCPAWTRSELAKRIQITNTPIGGRSWSALYNMTKSKLVQSPVTTPMNINPGETEMLFDISAAFTNGEEVYSVISTGTSFMTHNCEFVITVTPFEVTLPICKGYHELFVRLGIRAYIINQNLGIVKAVHVNQTCFYDIPEIGKLLYLIDGQTPFNMVSAQFRFVRRGDWDALKCLSCDDSEVCVNGMEYNVQDAFDSIVWH